MHRQPVNGAGSEKDKTARDGKLQLQQARPTLPPRRHNDETNSRPQPGKLQVQSATSTAADERKALAHRKQLEFQQTNGRPQKKFQPPALVREQSRSSTGQEVRDNGASGASGRCIARPEHSVDNGRTSKAREESHSVAANGYGIQAVERGGHEYDEQQISNNRHVQPLAQSNPDPQPASTVDVQEESGHSYLPLLDNEVIGREGPSDQPVFYSQAQPQEEESLLFIPPPPVYSEPQQNGRADPHQHHYPHQPPQQNIQEPPPPQHVQEQHEAQNVSVSVNNLLNEQNRHTHHQQPHYEAARQHPQEQHHVHVPDAPHHIQQVDERVTMPPARTPPSGPVITRPPEVQRPLSQAGQPQQCASAVNDVHIQNGGPMIVHEDPASLQARLAELQAALLSRDQEMQSVKAQLEAAEEARFDLEVAISAVEAEYKHKAEKGTRELESELTFARHTAAESAREATRALRDLEKVQALLSAKEAAAKEDKEDQGTTASGKRERSDDARESPPNAADNEIAPPPLKRPMLSRKQPSDSNDNTSTSNSMAVPSAVPAASTFAPTHVISRAVPVPQPEPPSHLPFLRAVTVGCRPELLALLGQLAESPTKLSSSRFASEGGLVSPVLSTPGAPRRRLTSHHHQRPGKTDACEPTTSHTSGKSCAVSSDVRNIGKGSTSTGGVGHVTTPPAALQWWGHRGDGPLTQRPLSGCSSCGTGMNAGGSGKKSSIVRRSAAERLMACLSDMNVGRAGPLDVAATLSELLEISTRLGGDGGRFAHQHTQAPFVSSPLPVLQILLTCVEHSALLRSSIAHAPSSAPAHAEEGGSSVPVRPRVEWRGIGTGAATEAAISVVKRKWEEKTNTPESSGMLGLASGGERGVSLGRKLRDQLIALFHSSVAMELTAVTAAVLQVVCCCLHDIEDQKHLACWKGLLEGGSLHTILCSNIEYDCSVKVLSLDVLKCLLRSKAMFHRVAGICKRRENRRQAAPSPPDAVVGQDSDELPLLRALCCDIFSSMDGAVEPDQFALYERVIRLLSYLCLRHGSEAAQHLLDDTVDSSEEPVLLIPRLISFIRAEVDAWEKRRDERQLHLEVSTSCVGVGVSPGAEAGGGERARLIREAFCLLVTLVPHSAEPLQELVASAGLQHMLTSLVDALYNHSELEHLQLFTEAKRLLPLLNRSVQPL